MTNQHLVIGATGEVGGQVVKGLLSRGQGVRAATRHPVAVGPRGPDGPGALEHLAFDFERPETFPPALDGVDRVFLIARPGDDQPERVAMPLIDEMLRRGVRYVVNLTSMGTDLHEDFGLRRVERYLEASGLDFTHLRPNWFMQVFSGGPLHAAIRGTGAFHLPVGDARISYIDLRDIAAVAVTALTEPGHAGKAYTLTGGASLHHDDVARMLTEAVGCPIGYVDITEEQARSALESAGLSAERAERLIGFYRLVREGMCAPVSGDVEAVLGREPIPFRRFATDHVAAWA